MKKIWMCTIILVLVCFLSDPAFAGKRGGGNSSKNGAAVGSGSMFKKQNQQQHQNQYQNKKNMGLNEDDAEKTRGQ